uniref:Threonyl-tRNA synthetase 1 n=1 Tax=Oryctolagus cuniculus TaxID=9986 RepID=A0A5F9D4N6_RABIT
MLEEAASSPSGKMGGEEKSEGAGEEKRKEGGKKKNKEGSGDGGRAEGDVQVLLISAFPEPGPEGVCS